MASCERGTQSDLSGKPTRIILKKNRGRVVEKLKGEGERSRKNATVIVPEINSPSREPNMFSDNRCSICWEAAFLKHGGRGE